MMSNYENSKKVRRIAAVAYLIIMSVIMTGTYFSQRQKEANRKETHELQVSAEIPNGFSNTSVQN